MAGRPKTRARREAERRRQIGHAPTELPAPTKAPRDAIPDAVPSRARAHAGAHDARAQSGHETQPPRAPRPLRSPLIGGATRAVADDAQAQTMRELSHLIKPGVDIRIERSRPTWAAGWLEDYPIDATGDALADLYEHLRDEHGGQLYKLTVMSPGEHPVYVGAVPIAGPVREQGRIITRETWDPPGRRERAPNPQQPAAAAAAPFPMGDLLGAVGSFLTLFMNQQKEAAQSQIEAVRDMVKNSQQQTADFTNALLQVRSDESSQRGLAGQISELMDGVNAVEAMRKRFGAAAAPAADDDDDMLKGALKDATSHFLGAVMGSMAQRRGGAARARAQPQRPPRRVVAPGSVRPLPQPNQVVGEQLQGIPDAIPGHAAAQN